MNKIMLTLFALPIACAADQLEIVTDGNVEGFIESYVTNLPTSITIKNGVLSFDHQGTNLWTSSEAHDWGSWLPNGSKNPSSEAIAINKPMLLQPVGTEWSAVGGFAVLSLSPGVSMSTSGGDASVTWTFPDGSSWKWLAESQIDVPAVPSGIALDIVDGSEVVRIDYAVSRDSPDLSILRSDSYAGAYAVVTNALWQQVSAGTRQAIVPTAGAKSGFFRAQVSASVPAHIEATCPIYSPAGVMTGPNDVNPVVYDTTIVIEQDGKRYRIPAEEVL